MSKIFAKPLCARDRRRSSKKSLNLGSNKKVFSLQVLTVLQAEDFF